MLHSLARRLPSAMRPSYARRVLLLLFLILVLDYADRALIGAMAPTLKREFSLNNAKLGFLSGTFVLVSAGAVIPLGVLTDRVNRTGMLAIVLVIWTCAITLTGASVSAAMLFGSRVLLGAISAATGPTVPSIVGDLVPPARRGAAVGAVGSGQLVGTGAGYILGALGVAVLSFRWGFWLLALAG
jgi:MFS family permease